MLAGVCESLLGYAEESDLNFRSQLDIVGHAGVYEGGAVGFTFVLGGHPFQCCLKAGIVKDRRAQVVRDGPNRVEGAAG